MVAEGALLLMQIIQIILKVHSVALTEEMEAVDAEEIRGVADVADVVAAAVVAVAHRELCPWWNLLFPMYPDFGMVEQSICLVDSEVRKQIKKIKKS